MYGQPLTPLPLLLVDFQLKKEPFLRLPYSLSYPIIKKCGKTVPKGTPGPCFQNNILQPVNLRENLKDSYSKEKLND